MATGKAKGVVLEAKLSSQRGPVATVLVKTGTLKVGDAFVIGSTYGRIRAMLNENGLPVQEAAPSTPVEILGINAVPQSGDLMEVMSDDRAARVLAESRMAADKAASSQKVTAVSLELLSRQIKEGTTKDLNLIIKADVRGSMEAIVTSLGKLSNAEVATHIILNATGDINEGDVMLAKASRGIVLAFRVGVPTAVTKMAEAEGIDIKSYDIIYQLIDDVKLAMEGMLETKYEEVETGRAELRQVFTSSKHGNILGCMVTGGKITRGQKVRIFRGDKLHKETVLESLKRFKDDVREVKEGFECGMVIEDFNDPKEADLFVFVTQVEVKRGIAAPSQPVAA